MRRPRLDLEDMKWGCLTLFGDVVDVLWMANTDMLSSTAKNILYQWAQHQLEGSDV